MTNVPDEPVTPAHPGDTRRISPAALISIIAAVASLLAAAALAMWTIIANPPGDTVGKAFLTLVIVVAFAFAVIGEARAAEHRKDVWITPVRILGHVLVLSSGLYLTWNQVYPAAWRDFWPDFPAWIGVIAVVEGVICTFVLFTPRMLRAMHGLVIRIALGLGIALVVVCGLLLVIPWTFWDASAWTEQYWRVVAALTVLAVVIFVIPLTVNAILRPPRPKAEPASPLYSFPQPVSGSQAVSDSNPFGEPQPPA